MAGVAETHQIGELVYGRVTKLVPFGAFIQVGDGIEGLVHISEMSAHHVDLPEQVVTPAEELWVKIIDLDPDRRRISLSIKHRDYLDRILQRVAWRFRPTDNSTEATSGRNLANGRRL